MTVFAALAGLIAVLTSWIVGGRLLGLARRTRQAPELLIGGALLLAGGVWSPFVAVGRQAVTLPDGVRTALVAIGGMAGVVGMAMLAVFNRRVFRPQEPWAALLAGTICAGLVGAFVAQSATVGWAEFARSERGPFPISSWLGLLIYGWSTLEAWRQHQMLARRRALGLADPVVTDRMRLWALTMSSTVVGAAVLAVCQLEGIPVGGTLVGLTTTGAIALATSTFLWLAFLPPAAYLARVRASAAVGG